MATKQEHLKQAEQNSRLADTLKRTAFHEWAVTAYFYSCLHYVEAFLAIQKAQTTSHTDRFKVMASNPQLKQVLGDYELLKNLSRQARYDAQPISPADLQDAETYAATVTAKIKGFMGIKD